MNFSVAFGHSMSVKIEPTQLIDTFLSSYLLNNINSIVHSSTHIFFDIKHKNKYKTARPFLPLPHFLQSFLHHSIKIF